jgi:penicillin-binding protein 1A
VQNCDQNHSNKEYMSKSTNKLTVFVYLALFGLFSGLVMSSAIVLYLQPRLPDIDQINDIRLQVPLRVYSADNLLLGEFGEKKRSPLSYDKVPQQFIDAILAAEDDRFFSHDGVSIVGLLRAAVDLITTGSIQSGGSTITMQVAKNYFLTRERTFTRKFTEILLSLQLERELSKQKILELYLNKIFLGKRAYGVQAAAQVYYGKPIDELTLAQHAMIAGLPIAPSKYNPIIRPERALLRRNWIIGRMAKLGYITAAEKENSLDDPITATYHGTVVELYAPHVAEMVRQEMINKYGLKAYTDGYVAYTTVDSILQSQANSAVIEGLMAYDKRHGYRGPESTISFDENTNRERLIKSLKKINPIAELHPALVLTVGAQQVQLLLADESEITLGWEQGISTARPYITENRQGPKPQAADDVLMIGDVVRVQKINNLWQLAQIPKAQAALVSLEPQSGAIKALVGGFNFSRSNFNRATQAKRQPGSNFKPFLYAAALENGFTTASIINDAPVVFENSGLENTWRPENSSGKFYGPTTLRKALYQSRNLVSIRLLRSLGVDTVIKYAENFGFDGRDLPRNLSLALGTQASTPMQVVTAYARLANGGFKVSPFLIAKVATIDNEILFEANPAVACHHCNQPKPLANEILEELLASEELTDLLPTKQSAETIVNDINVAPQIADPRTMYLIDSLLMDVVKKGTARKALVLERNDIAGKTGTTNGPTDAWFSGYNPSIVTTTWVGFDQYEMLGRREYGGSAALPIWIDYMRVALAGKPDLPRPRPNGLVSVRIDPTTGALARPDQENAIFEVFLAENVPQESKSSKQSNGGSNSFNQIDEGDLF